QAGCSVRRGPPGSRDSRQSRHVDGVSGLGGHCVLCDQFSDTVGMGVSPLVRNRRLVLDADSIVEASPGAKSCKRRDRALLGGLILTVWFVEIWGRSDPV